MVVTDVRHDGMAAGREVSCGSVCVTIGEPCRKGANLVGVSTSGVWRSGRSVGHGEGGSKVTRYEFVSYL